LRGYDYTKEGWYFVTIEPNDQRYPFCKIKNNNVQLYEIGKIINEHWKWIFSRYDHIEMDEYIIMPDHFHGIIRILPESYNECADDGAYIGENVWEALEPPSGQRAGQDPPVHLDQNHQNRLGLSNIIGAFKMTSSKLIHEAGYQDFKWKRSFHDRIIREDEIKIKRAYIQNNPKNWKRKY